MQYQCNFYCKYIRNRIKIRVILNVHHSAQLCLTYIRDKFTENYFLDEDIQGLDSVGNMFRFEIQCVDFDRYVNFDFFI